jgi:hypothetical protein
LPRTKFGDTDGDRTTSMSVGTRYAALARGATTGCVATRRERLPPATDGVVSDCDDRPLPADAPSNVPLQLCPTLPRADAVGMTLCHDDAMFGIAGVAPGP